MSYLREVDLGATFPPFASFHDHFGFVPTPAMPKLCCHERLRPKLESPGLFLLKSMLCPVPKKSPYCLRLLQSMEAHIASRSTITRCAPWECRFISSIKLSCASRPMS